VPLGSLKQEVETLREALNVLREGGAAGYIPDAEANLARAEALLAERRGKSAAE
jgi:hypothetical protein